MRGLFPAGGQLAWLSACYFFFFGILGVMVPIWGYFLTTVVSTPPK